MKFQDIVDDSVEMRDSDTVEGGRTGTRAESNKKINRTLTIPQREPSNVC